MTHIIHTPIWKIFIGPKYSNCRYLFPILLLHFITAILEGSSFAFILFAFSAIEGKQIQDLKIQLFPQIANWLSTFSSMELFYFFLFLAIGCQAFRGLVGYFAMYGTSSLALKVQTFAQKQVYQQIFKFSFPFVSQYKIGDLNEYVKAPSTFIPSFFDALNRFLVTIFMIVGLICALFWISPVLTVITLVLFGMFALLQKMLIKKVTFFSEKLTGQLFELSHQTVQSLQGLRPIHIFHKYEYILKKIEGLLERIAKSCKKAYLWNGTIPAINEGISVLLVGTILVLGSSFLANAGDLALPNLLTYVALTYRLATRLQIGMGALGSAGIHFGLVLRLNEILDDQGKEYLPEGGRECANWERDIEFRNISLQYPNTSNYALNQVSFLIAKGSTVAFVGLSGAGKSSILDLILGLRRPTEGEILIDDHPLHAISYESWRKKIGVVSQDTYVFNDTMEENIRFGDFGATGEQIKTVAALAGASDFIANLPEGYNTVIGERGYKLSGGERQRIVLARALLKNPEILILDEATSSLDSYSEYLIQRSLDLMHNNKTMVVVAHRLSTIVKADQIFVLEEGRIIEKGCHEELLSYQGRYAELWNLQSAESIKSDVT